MVIPAAVHQQQVPQRRRELPDHNLVAPKWIGPRIDARIDPVKHARVPRGTDPALRPLRARAATEHRTHAIVKLPIALVRNPHQDPTSGQLGRQRRPAPEGMNAALARVWCGRRSG
jgi:hypothetical protein